MSPAEATPFESRASQTFVPSRFQYGVSNKNEIKTEISGEVEARYKDFSLVMGGRDKTYESFANLPVLLTSFNPNVQEYDVFANFGYKNSEVFFEHDCVHPVVSPDNDNYGQPLYITDQTTGKSYFINGAEIIEFGIKEKF